MGNRPQTTARTTAATLIRQARDAGWTRAKIEIKPDGSVSIDAAMDDVDGREDFLTADLRMQA